MYEFGSESWAKIAVAERYATKHVTGRMNEKVGETIVERLHLDATHVVTAGEIVMG